MKWIKLLCDQNNNTKISHEKDPINVSYHTLIFISFITLTSYIWERKTSMSCDYA